MCLLRVPCFYGNAHEQVNYYTGTQWIANNISIINTAKHNNTTVDKQMHIFCDASSKAYAAVIYWRFTRSNGRVLVCFVASKW